MIVGKLNLRTNRGVFNQQFVDNNAYGFEKMLADELAGFSLIDSAHSDHANGYHFTVFDEPTMVSEYVYGTFLDFKKSGSPYTLTLWLLVEENPVLIPKTDLL